ncbi:RNA binding [Cordyceps militaris]|uniref:RNA binding n=1 Tax=Cordyceps militaris TaxID=73501 RepID=A0A2H4SCH3_CORMI|nr:RNA binding [Cordyceps militaris]
MINACHSRAQPAMMEFWEFIKRAKEGRGSMFDESAGYRKRLFDLSFHDSFTKPGASCQPVCGAYLLHLVFFQV